MFIISFGGNSEGTWIVSGMMLNITENIVEIYLQFDFILKCHLNVMVSCYAFLGAPGALYSLGEGHGSG